MTVQMLSTLNLNRMSCKACLFDGRVSINDTDDNYDREETTVWLAVIPRLGLVKLIPLRL